MVIGTKILPVNFTLFANDFSIFCRGINSNRTITYMQEITLYPTHQHYKSGHSSQVSLFRLKNVNAPFSLIKETTP